MANHNRLTSFDLLGDLPFIARGSYSQSMEGLFDRFEFTPSSITHPFIARKRLVPSAMQVMTVVEGRIPKTKTSEFLAMYASVKDQPKPRGWKRSMLLHDTDEEGLYRISTLWESRGALEQMRLNTKVPFAVLTFRTHGAEPKVRIFDVPLAFEI